ncbi:MAG: DUF6371 domain-containing protein [Calditrichaceae bacterium]
MSELIFSNIRTRCPACNARRGFAPIRGHERQPYGKCFACGEFIPVPGSHTEPQTAHIKTSHSATGYVMPPATKRATDKPGTRQGANKTESIQPRQYISEYQVFASQTDLQRDRFAAGLMELGIPESHLIRCNLGRGRNNRTLFFYQDIQGRFVNAKEFVYSENLHRDKAIFPKFMFSKKQNYETCLFGEFQLHNRTRNTPVIMVESEKTVIVGSYAMPDKVWIATGGTTGLTRDKAKVLRNRNVSILFDNDKPGRENADRTKESLESISIHAKVIDLFSNQAEGWDIADYLISRLRELQQAIQDLSEYEREIFEERAAIMEYQGGLSKYEAEVQTLKGIKNEQHYLP